MTEAGGTLAPAGDWRAGGRRAVFLDRDGTLTEPRHYPAHPDDLVLQPGIGPPLRALQDDGIALIVVTNQSGVARGLFDESALAPMHERLRELLAQHGVQLDAIYACPHHPDGTVARFRRTCACRKPAAGMLRQAAADLALELTGSWIIGDTDCDIDAGRRAGTHTALTAPEPLPGITPDVFGTTTASVLSQVHGRLRRNTSSATVEERVAARLQQFGVEVEPHRVSAVTRYGAQNDPTKGP